VRVWAMNRRRYVSCDWSSILRNTSPGHFSLTLLMLQTRGKKKKKRRSN
jgi:hypothetical protein